MPRDLGPNTGTARLTAVGKSGKPMKDKFTVLRKKGTWQVVVFAGQPDPSEKTSSSTGMPNS
ncbi:hypothetical protein ACF1GW_17990 [Streptomyces achromogenes]|uniref:hypothetical protein n=1 Tax=Streptomyces achromogenes TaxID=67255 RepID=UPI0036FC7676